MLARLERVEAEMALLYEWLSDVFNDDDEVSGLFFRMSLHERSHASLLRYGNKLARRSPENFGDVDFEPELAEALLASVASFRTGSPRPSLGQALLFAMKAECHPAENGYRSVLAVSNPAIGQIIRGLAIADAEHYRTLRELAHRRVGVFD